MPRWLMLTAVMAVGFGAQTVVTQSAMAQVQIAQVQIAQAPPPNATTENPESANLCGRLAEAACGTNQGCSWLPGYKVPGGAEIKGYCRPAPRSIRARRAPGVGPTE